MKQVNSLKRVEANGLQAEKLKKALALDPALAALIYAFVIKVLTFVAGWFMDESGNRLPFWKAVKAFFSKEFWDAVAKLQAEGASLGDKLS